MDLLNVANVAHLDMRPANIFWRIWNEVIEMQLIDFESVFSFWIFIGK